MASYSRGRPGPFTILSPMPCARERVLKLRVRRGVGPTWVDIQMNYRFDFSAEIVLGPLASKHRLTLLWTKNSRDRGRKAIPFSGFFP